MTPIRFGANGRQLFGIYHPPTGPGRRDECVLLCSPFGQEAIRCHRLLRVLAERLSRGGFGVLRFDYFGTGDSDGSDDAADLDTWIANILQANDELIRLSGQPRGTWFGLRLGATLAAIASTRGTSAPHRLVLWDPVADGSGYLVALAQAHADARRLLPFTNLRLPPARVDERTAVALTEALGFPLPAELRRQLQELSPATIGRSRAARVHAIGSRKSRDWERLQPTFAANGAGVVAHEIETHIAWATDTAMNLAIVPAEATQTIMACLTEDVAGAPA